jgi:hypothetical protein
MINVVEKAAVTSGKGTVTLPPGMTQEEANRLVRETDERTSLKETSSNGN